MTSRNLFHFLRDFREHFWIVPRYFREHFPIKKNVVCFEFGDELAVGEAVLPCRRVDLDVPQSAEIAFFLASVREHIQESMHSCFPHSRDFGISSRAESFSVLPQVFSSFVGGYASFNSWHG